MKSANRMPCPACRGSGKVIAGYGVVCTELVEKLEKCPECKGSGCLKRK